MYLWLFEFFVINETPLKIGMAPFYLHKDNKNSFRSNFLFDKKWEHSTLVAEASVTLADATMWTQSSNTIHQSGTIQMGTETTGPKSTWKMTEVSFF